MRRMAGTCIWTTEQKSFQVKVSTAMIRKRGRMKVLLTSPRARIVPKSLEKSKSDGRDTVHER
jgi:ribosomal protein L28